MSEIDRLLGDFEEAHKAFLAADQSVLEDVRDFLAKALPKVAPAARAMIAQGGAAAGAAAGPAGAAVALLVSVLGEAGLALAEKYFAEAEAKEIPQPKRSG